MRVAPKLKVSNGRDTRGFSYRNINTAVMGRLLTNLYGRPLEQLLSEKIWRPAGASTARIGGFTARAGR